MWWRNPNPSKRLQPTKNQSFLKHPNLAAQSYATSIQHNNQASWPTSESHLQNQSFKLGKIQGSIQSTLNHRKTGTRTKSRKNQRLTCKSGIASINLRWAYDAVSTWRFLARAESAMLGDAGQPKSWNAIVMWRNVQEIQGNEVLVSIIMCRTLQCCHLVVYASPSSFGGSCEPRI